MPARYEVLRLQLLAGAGRKAHAKVRQPFIPGAGHAHLLRTILGGKFSNRVQIPDGAFGPEKFRGCFEFLPFFDATLYPNFVDTLLLPAGTKADRAGAGRAGVKVASKFTERRGFIHIRLNDDAGTKSTRAISVNPTGPTSNHL